MVVISLLVKNVNFTSMHHANKISLGRTRAQTLTDQTNLCTTLNAVRQCV